MWVDDHIFDDWWENKEHIEKASTFGTNINVHFIPKSNTQSALKFLRSEFGKRLTHSKTFRIMTDMHRENESPSDNAGARFIYEVRKLGFNHPCLVFTIDQHVANEKVAAVFHNEAHIGIEVTQSDIKLEEFVTFK